VKKFYVITLLVLAGTFAKGQKDVYTSIFNSAKSYFVMQNFQKALPLFLILDSISPGNANISYHIGHCYLNTPNDKSKAITYLENATMNIADKYINNAKQTGAPAAALYFLGKAYLINYDLDKSIAVTEKFRNRLNENASAEELVNALSQIEMCKVAKEMIKKPILIKVENVGASINTIFPEYAPVIDPQENTMIFTSRRNVSTGGMMEENGFYFEDIYISNKDNNGKWTEAKPIGALINTEDHEATISISSDKKQLFIYKSDKGQGNIYICKLENGEWGKPKKLPAPINSRSWETHASLSPDGNTIYFTSNRKGGFGGMDIYKCEKNTDGNWGEALNLGAGVNTPFDEDGPFVLPDGKTLFFCSNGHQTMGGYDIFYSRSNKEGVWSRPTNMGYPLNTTDDDLFYSPVDSLNGYFASVRNDGYGNLDIYKVSVLKKKWVKIAGIAQEKSTGEAVPGSKISLINEAQEVIAQAVADASGKFSFEADFNKNYIIIGKKEGYFDGSTNALTYGEEATVNVVVLLEKIPELSFKATITDLKTAQAIKDVNIQITDLITGKNENYTTQSNGSCIKLLSEKKVGDSLNFRIKISKEGYVVKTVNFRYLITKPGEIVLNETIGKIEVGVDLAKLIEIKPIYFDLNKYNIRKDAAIELDKIVSIMKQYPSMVIELGSHTDCRGNSASNISLSDKRAKASAAYIVSKGISQDRITGKGYGETKPVNKCKCEGAMMVPCTEEEHQMNRRTEFIIVKF
jgi:outer membrane protein OmpA-like peptidoglycan-associated protein/Tol biopolymer transport system component